MTRDVPFELELQPSTFTTAVHVQLHLWIKCSMMHTQLVLQTVDIVA
jgi:hypothetical protein